MNFDELLKYIEEDRESGENLADKFKRIFEGDNVPEFIGFDYVNEKGERAHYTVNIGLDYQKIKESNLNKINKAISNPDAVKSVIQPKLEKIAGSPEGEVNGQPVQSILTSVPEILSKIESAESRSMARIEQEAPTAAAAGFETVAKGIKRNMDTGYYYISGVVRSRKLSGEPAEYKAVKSRNPVNAGEPFVKKYLKLSKPQFFVIDPSKISAINVRKEKVDLDGVESIANVVELGGEFSKS